MALHDSDIRGDERNSPAVNAHDMQDIAQRKAHGTNSVNYITDATDPTLVAGIYNGTFEIVRIMEQTVTIPNFTSDSSNWKLQQNIETVAHGLDVVPVIVGSLATAATGTTNYTPFVTIPDNYMATSVGGSTVSPYFVQYEAYADNTDVTFRVRTMIPPGFTFNGYDAFFRIYLLKQKATSALT